MMKSTTTTVTKAALQKLRKDIVKSLKPLLTYEYLRRKNKKDYCPVTAHVPRVSKAEYAALIGRPSDTELTSVVKQGAWYREVVSFDCLFGTDHPPIVGTGGRYGCNRELGINLAGDIVVRYKPSNETVSVEAIIQHEATFDHDDYY